MTHRTSIRAMTVFLITLLATAANAGDATTTLQDRALAAWQAGHKHAAAGKTEKAIAKYTEMIEITAGSRELESFRAMAYGQRGHLHLKQEQPAKALTDFNTAIDVDRHGSISSWIYQGRARAYELLGQTELAEADKKRARRLLRRMQIRGWYYRYIGRFVNRWTLVGGPVVGALFLLGFVTALLLGMLNCAIGRRQQREGGGGFVRLLWVSAVFGMLQAAPILPLLLTVPRSMPETTRSAVVGTFVVCFALNFVLLILSLRPPVRPFGVKEPLPLVEDDALLARVSDLSFRMGIACPRVRLFRSPGGPLLVAAWAGGLPAPSLVVSDGVLHRLTAEERDAVLAHELAHIANDSLWYLTAVTPVAAVAAVTSAAFVPVGVALALGFALRVGLYRLVCRRYEFDCDRRAAGLMGFREMTTALQKIHAVHPVKNTGPLSLLVYATATHPSLQRRLGALYDASPEQDRPELTAETTSLRRHRWAERIALAVWSLTLVMSVIAAGTTENVPLAIGALFLVGSVPFGLLLSGFWRHTARAGRRTGNMMFLRVLALGMVVGLVVFGVFLGVNAAFQEPLDSADSTVSPLMIVLGPPLLLLILLLFKRRSAKLQVDVTLALQDRDFERVLELGRRHPKRVAQNTALRYNLALAAGLNGDRARAIAELEQLRLDKPRFQLTGLVLAQFYLDENQPELAQQIAEESAKALRRDPAPYVLLARAFRQLGEIEQAQTAIKRALVLEPDEGVAHAVAAALALDRGDSASAQQSIGVALQHAPGDAFTLTVQTEAELREDNLERARQALELARTVIEANPFTILGRRLQDVTDQLNAADVDAAASPSSLTRDPHNPDARET